MNLLNYFGGNREAITIGCGIFTTALCYSGKIDGTIYAAVIIATVGAYIGGATSSINKAASDAS